MSEPTITQTMQQMMDKINHLEATLTFQQNSLTRQRRVVIVMALAMFLLLVVLVGGLWSGPLQAQAQTGPKSNVVSSGPSASLPKFCAGCDRSGRSYPVGTDLSFAYFAGANYSNANLSYSYLQWINLEHANLAGANLSHSSLYSSSLNYANVSNADLSYDELTSVYLQNGTLTNVKFNNSNLTGANLAGSGGTPSSITGVTWAYTTCPDGSNTGVAGTCVGHWIP